MTNVELNELLKKAKDSQKAWDVWETEGPFDRSPKWIELCGTARDAWDVLHKAIVKASPLTLHMENGKTRDIRTAGMLTADQMMYYSESVNARYTMEGTNLKFVNRIEKGENR